MDGGSEDHAHPFRKVLKTLLVGLATVIPILGTGWIIVLVFRLLHRLGEGLISLVLRWLNRLRGRTPGGEGSGN